MTADQHLLKPWLACLLILMLTPAIAAKQVQLVLPKTRLYSSELAVIVNQADPVSLKIAKYYQKKRAIPQQNMIFIKLPPKSNRLSPHQFNLIKKQVYQKTPAHVQAYLLAWREPFQVGCMSITSAFAFGYDQSYCASGCKPTRVSPYYNNPSIAPYHQFKIRPTMLLGTNTFRQAKALIDRGVISDKSFPTGNVYLVSTSDKARNVRSRFYPLITRHFTNFLSLTQVNANSIENRDDVLFYFTGLTKVAKITSNRYLPGAIADHLTSTGGRLNGGNQMPADQWLQAGATASYGTVVEPCNFTQKFPNPYLVIYFYYKGASLIEAYWKSVAMPGQGLFIGEPLAHPFAGYRFHKTDKARILTTTNLFAGLYVLIRLQKNHQYKVIKRYLLKKNIGPNRLVIPALAPGSYRLIHVSPDSYLIRSALRRLHFYTLRSVSGPDAIPLIPLFH